MEYSEIIGCIFFGALVGYIGYIDYISDDNTTTIITSKNKNKTDTNVVYVVCENTGSGSSAATLNGSIYQN